MSLLELSEAKYSEWRYTQFRPEWETRISEALHGDGFSHQSARRVQEVALELLSLAAQKRIELYVEVVREWNDANAFSKPKLSALQIRIKGSVECVAKDLKSRIDRFRMNRGNDAGEAAMPDPQSYFNLVSNILDLVNHRLNVLKAEGRISKVKSKRKAPTSIKINKEILERQEAGASSRKGSAQGATAMFDSDFWLDLKSQFQELSDPERSLKAQFIDGHWFVSGQRDDEMQEKIRKTFRTLAERAAIAAGIPNRADPLDAWVFLLRHQNKFLNSWLVRDLAAVSADYCDVLANGAIDLEAAAVNTREPVGLRRGRYGFDTFLKAYPSEPRANSTADLKDWKVMVWREYGLWIDAVAESPASAHRNQKVYSAIAGVSYDFAVLLANDVFDRGLRGEEAIHTFTDESAVLREEITRAWHSVCDRLSVSDEFQTETLMDLALPFQRVLNDVSYLFMRLRWIARISGGQIQIEGVDKVGTVSIGSLKPDPTFWRELRADFESLKGFRIEIVWKSKVRPGDGHWSIHCVNHTNERALESQFKSIATKGAKGLGHNSVIGWCDKLREMFPTDMVHVTTGGLTTRDFSSHDVENFIFGEGVTVSIALCHLLEAETQTIAVNSTMDGQLAHQTAAVGGESVPLPAISSVGTLTDKKRSLSRIPCPQLVKRIEVFRLAKGYNWTDLAILLQITPRTLRKMINTKQALPSNIDGFAKAMSTTKDELLAP